MMRRRRLPLAALGLLLAWLGAGVDVAPPVAAGEEACLLDRVRLQNGRIFEGRVLQDDAEGVLLEMTSETGGRGRMFFPRHMIGQVERAAVEGTSARPAGTVRDAWYLLKSGPHVVGARHLALRQVRNEGEPGWRLEETIEQFPRGPHVPTVRIQHAEQVDLAFRPLSIQYREVGEASPDPRGPRRYERILSGPVKDGVWQALIHEGGEARQQVFPLEDGMRGRLGAREHLLHQREAGVRSVTFFSVGRLAPVTVRAGYTAIGQTDEAGRMYDEFVWEEQGARRVSRFRDFEVLEETLAESVVAVPSTEAQVEAARHDASGGLVDDEPGLLRLPEAGVAFQVPGATWQASRVEAAPGARGWRRLAVVENPVYVADVRVEWDPEGVATTPTQDEAAVRLEQRLRAWCPDLRVVEPRRPLSVGGEGAAWRIAFTGTLRGERVRTIAVVIDQGSARVLFLLACPEVSWAQAASAFERLVASIRRL